jgi:nucleoside-diphosphate-sugar epimerase
MTIDSERINILSADYYDNASRDSVLKNAHFDCVIDFINMNAETMDYSVNFWRGRTDQYIFISSASVYEKPLRNPIVTEKTPVGNPFWLYSRNKIAAENRLNKEIAKGFPGMIVRPSLTYSDSCILFSFYSTKSSWPVLDRILRRKPIIVQGDGLSLWSITHNSDFASGILGLVGKPKATGETFHITTDEIITWDGIYTALGEALGVEPELCHISSQSIIKHKPDYEGILLGDHSNSIIFDNTKIKRFVPEFKSKVTFKEGAKRCVSWFNTHPEAKITDNEWNSEMDFLASIA